MERQAAIAAWIFAVSAAVVAVAEAPAPKQELCRTATVEKLGVTLHRVCPREPGRAPFWLTTPLVCGQGEHGSLPCPYATALSEPASAPIHARPVAMMDGLTAHRTCGMRFAGRLPTRAEREAARELLGAVTLLAAEGPDRSGELSLSELPEWLSEGACENPSLLGANCKLSAYPLASPKADLAWQGVRACDATPIATHADSAEVAVLGQSCFGEAPRVAGAVRAGVPRTCLLSSRGGGAGLYRLLCRTPGGLVHPEVPEEPIAAVRCMVADGLVQAN